MVILALAATALVAVDQSDAGLSPRELLRAGALESTDAADPATQQLEDHLSWTFELLADPANRMSDEDLARRFAPSFSALHATAEFNGALDLMAQDFGPIRFVRHELRNDREVVALAVSESGTPMLVTLVVEDDGRLAVWGVDEAPGHTRFDQWEVTVAVLVAWLFLAAAFVARRVGSRREPWVLLGTAAAFLALTAVRADDPVLYALGRCLPPAAVVGSVVLLAGKRSTTRAGWAAVALATAAAVAAAVAPFTRDPLTVANPAMATLVDDAATYRALLAGAATLTALAMALVATTTALHGDGRTRWAEPLRWATVAVASVWAAAAAAAAVDIAISDGAEATVELFALSAACAAATAAIATVRAVDASLDRPELADLVIELDGGEGDLQQAVARSLDDPSARVLAADGDGTLVDEHGRPAGADPAGPQGVVTTVTRGGTTIGALLTDGTIRHPPTRLTATAAAVGMALEVSRLTHQVLEQLGEVEASRARIVQASDAARQKLERDLHDGAQQRLVALGILLQRARRAVGAGDHPEALDLLDAATAEVRTAIDDVRFVSRGAPPALLSDRGLAAAIEALTEHAPVHVGTTVDASDLSDDEQVTVYYVVAEGLTNVSKHAAARHAQVCVVADQEQISMAVTDDGRGGADPGLGRGLQGLHDRVDAAGGDFAVESGPGGTTLRATIPRRGHGGAAT